MADSSSDDHSATSDYDSEADRPNRWEGPSSTWQDMNRAEINTFTGLNEIRNRDLSVHLYNAFALKQRHENPPGEGACAPVAERDINAATGQTVQPDDWLPQRTWTAWPVRKDRVPLEGFMKHDEDADEKFTIRRPRREVPSVALEEAVGAAVLRFAKERFDARPWEDAGAGDEFEDEEDEEDEDEMERGEDDESTDGLTSRSTRLRSRTRSVKGETRSDDERNVEDVRMGIDSDESGSEEENPIPLRERMFKPAVSTDDQLSYNLMRPAVRSILTRLDATLMVLHNSRDAAVNYFSDSSEDSEDSEMSNPTRHPRISGSEPPAKKSRGRPARAGFALRIRTPPPLQDSGMTGGGMSQGANQSTSQEPTPKKRGGRPRKVYPRLGGETDREWAIRVARLRKEPIPFFRDSPATEDHRSSDSEAQPRRRRATKRKTPKPREVSSNDSEARRIMREKNRNRLGLRDWKDVLGAAALAGFPQAALDRAARRCADLFGQSMELRTMAEGPIECDEQDKLVRYHPGMISDLPAESEEEEDDTDEETRSQTKRHIRSSSAVSEDERGRSRSRSRSRGRTRSRSSSVACSHFCRIRDCSRGVDGFSRRGNLLRHMRLVHDLDADEMPTDVDSDDELIGAVHVDGFLKPIKIRKGWRGDDSRAGSSKRRYGGRYRSLKSGSAERAEDERDEQQDITMADG
ncbi:hypothetical protein BJ170DRAFT_629334 [Xylariales sp. AK1849]|nr:hypothetical protein BJ170DRAFT_629334 [Xylariales sp. AK1849]